MSERPPSGRLREDPTTETDCDGMGTGAGLELREQMADVRLHRFLREEEHLADLAVDETFGDEPEHLDLARGGLLLELAQRSRERDDLGTLASTPGRRSVEALGMIGVPAQDLIPLDRVHECRIGRFSAEL